jgi:hypothetical protein
MGPLPSHRGAQQQLGDPGAQRLQSPRLRACAVSSPSSQRIRSRRNGEQSGSWRSRKCPGKGASNRLIRLETHPSSSLVNAAAAAVGLERTGCSRSYGLACGRLRLFKPPVQWSIVEWPVLHKATAAPRNRPKTILIAENRNTGYVGGKKRGSSANIAESKPHPAVSRMLTCPSWLPSA